MDVLCRQAVVHNLGMLQMVASKIGGIPDMLSVEDFSCEHGPDERVVLLYTSFLCARLLDISREERAAHMIQGAWRKHRSHQPGTQSPGEDPEGSPAKLRLGRQIP